MNITKSRLACLLIALLCCWIVEDADGQVRASRYPYENLDFYKDSLSKYIDSGDYTKDIEDEIAPAIGYLKYRFDLENHKPVNRRKRLAIVLDIDDTALSNLPEMRQNEDYGYDKVPFNNWILQAKCPANRPILALYKAAVMRDVHVFFITGRRKSDLIAPGVDSNQFFAKTLENLRLAGYWKVQAADLSLREPDDKSPVSDYKSSQRITLVKQGYEIILNVGDQNSDLAETGSMRPTYERPIKVTDPFYIIP